MRLQHTRALKRFKNEVGQINHMLITIYVGLDGIVPHNLSVNPGLHTTWNPKSKAVSVDRSRIFARKATMAWLVDCLDMYMRLINQSPMLFLSDDLMDTFSKVKFARSIYNRFKAVNDAYGIDTVDAAMVDLLICWRNRMVHYNADNNILAINRTKLDQNSAAILAKHCGLTVGDMLDHFDANEIPTFKEVTSLVRATIAYVRDLDNRLLSTMDLVAYADRIMVHYFSEVGNQNKHNGNSRLNNVYCKGPDARLQTLYQILQQNGFYEPTEKEQDDKKITVAELAVNDFCKKLAQMDHKTAAACIEAGSFLAVGV